MRAFHCEKDTRPQSLSYLRIKAELLYDVQPRTYDGEVGFLVEDEHGNEGFIGNEDEEGPRSS